MKNIEQYSAVVLGFIAFIMLFFTVFTFEGEAIKGLALITEQSIASFSLADQSVADSWLERNLLVIAAFILPLLGGVLAILDKRLIVAGVILPIAGALMLYLSASTIVVVYEVIGFTGTADIDVELGAGAFVHIIASVLAGVIALVNMVRT